MGGGITYVQVGDDEGQVARVLGLLLHGIQPRQEVLPGKIEKWVEGDNGERSSNGGVGIDVLGGGAGAHCPSFSLPLHH